MLNFYPGMLSQNVILLLQLTEQEKLRYLEKPLSNIHLQKAALVFMSSSKSHEGIELAGAKRPYTDHSLNSLRSKQLIQEVTTAKSFVKLGTLPATDLTFRYPSFQPYLTPSQFETWLEVEVSQQTCFQIKGEMQPSLFYRYYFR